MSLQSKEWRGHFDLVAPTGVEIAIECMVIAKKDGGFERLIAKSDLERVFRGYGIRDYQENFKKYQSEISPKWLKSDAFNKSVFADYMKFDNELSQILFKGLLRVGVVPLVDESTGYQYARPDGELQKRFKANVKIIFKEE